MKKMAGRALAIVGFMLFLATPIQAKTEYLCLTANGDDMAPAICDGDTVKVKICTDGSLIRAGSANSTNPGDIIVYCAGAALAQPESMWACGRAISKYFRDGHWYLKTQLDNNPEPDPWEVPDYFLLGVVAEVTHNGNLQNKPPTSDGNSSIKLPNIPTFLLELTTGIAFGLLLGSAAKKALSYNAEQSTRYSFKKARALRKLHKQQRSIDRSLGF
jgi:hypothetical protein